MKRSFLAICSCLLLFAACKEIDPIVTLPTPSIDTTYVVDTFSTAPHNVLVEEFTGQGCPNCPKAHTQLEAEAAANPGRVNIIGMYIFGPPQATPDKGSAYNFQDSTATNLANDIYETIGFLPAAGIDRISHTLFSSSSWNGDIASQLTLTDSLNLSVTSTYNTNPKDSVTTATITTTVTYTQAVSDSQYLCIALVEDSMVDLQEDNAAASGIDTFYLFTNVFRGMVTLISGDKILPSYTSKEPGRVEQRIYTYKLPKKSPAIVPAHCRIIAYVTEEAGYPVLQSAQCKLAP